MSTSLVRREMRLVEPRTTRLLPLDYAFLGQAIKNGHNRGVGARTGGRQRRMNIAHRSLAQTPQGIHAIEFQRRKIQYGAADPSTRYGGHLVRLPKPFSS